MFRLANSAKRRRDGKGCHRLPLQKIIDDSAVVGDDRQGDARLLHQVKDAVKIAPRGHRQQRPPGKNLLKEGAAAFPQLLLPCPIDGAVHIRNI